MMVSGMMGIRLWVVVQVDIWADCGQNKSAGVGSGCGHDDLQRFVCFVFWIVVGFVWRQNAILLSNRGTISRIETTLNWTFSENFTMTENYSGCAFGMDQSVDRRITR